MVIRAEAANASDACQLRGRSGRFTGFEVIVFKGPRPGFEIGRVAAAAMEIDALRKVSHGCHHQKCISGDIGNCEIEDRAQFALQPEARNLAGTGLERMRPAIVEVVADQLRCTSAVTRQITDAWREWTYYMSDSSTI